MAITRDDVICWLPLDNSIEDYAQAVSFTNNGGSTSSTDTPGVGIGSWDFESGSSQYLETPDQSITGSHSVSLWAKFESTATNMVLIDCGGSFDGQLTLSYSTTFNLQANAEWAGGQKSTAGVAVSTGTWYHIVAVVDDSAKTVAIYIDGSLDNTTTASSGALLDNGSVTRIGNRSDTDNRYYDGLLRDVVIFNKALDSTEVSDIYNSGTGKTWTDYFGLDDNLVHYYSFDSNADDEIGTTDGTVSGATNTDAFLSNGYDFNGTSDYIQLSSGTTGIINNAVGDFTVACWVNFDTTTNRQFVYSTRNNDGDYAFGWKTDNATNVIQARAYNGSSFTYIDSAVTSPSGWYMLMLTYDSATDEFNFYVNEGVTTATINLSTNGTSQNHVTIGGFNNGGGLYFDGKGDELALWDRVLTPGEAKRWYNYGCGRVLNELTTSAEHPLLEGLAEYYSMEDLTAQRGYFGDLETTGGTPSTTTGVVDNGQDFERSENDGVDSAKTVALDNNISIMYFMNQESQPGNMCMFSQDTTGTSYNWVHLYRPTPGDLTWGDAAGFGTWNVTINTATWYHIAMTADGSTLSDLGCFVDAVDQGANDSSAGTWNGINGDAQEIVWGSQYPGGGAQFDGILDECGLWRRKVVQADVSSHYNSGSGLAYPFGVVAAEATKNSLFFGGGL